MAGQLLFKQSGGVRFPSPHTFYALREDARPYAPPKVMEKCTLLVGLLTLAGFVGQILYQSSPAQGTLVTHISRNHSMEGYECKPLTPDPTYGLVLTYEECLAKVELPSAYSIVKVPKYDDERHKGEWYWSYMPFAHLGVKKCWDTGQSDQRQRHPQFGNCRAEHLERELDWANAEEEKAEAERFSCYGQEKQMCYKDGLSTTCITLLSGSSEYDKDAFIAQSYLDGACEKTPASERKGNEANGCVRNAHCDANYNVSDHRTCGKNTLYSMCIAGVEVCDVYDSDDEIEQEEDLDSCGSSCRSASIHTPIRYNEDGTIDVRSWDGVQLSTEIRYAEKEPKYIPGSAARCLRAYRDTWVGHDDAAKEKLCDIYKRVPPYECTKIEGKGMLTVLSLSVANTQLLFAMLAGSAAICLKRRYYHEDETDSSSQGSKADAQQMTISVGRGGAHV